MSVKLQIRATVVVFSLLLDPVFVHAQGFAGLGGSADGFAIPQPEPRFNFPNDHGPHMDFRIEWWYLTANLQATDGAEFGTQWTLFRSGSAPEDIDGWQSPQFWMAHAALTTAQDHWSAENLARGGIGQAGVRSEPFSAWIDNWHMTSPDASLNQLSVHADGAEFSYSLNLSAEGPLVFHGKDGYSVKSEQGQASYYYSQPHYTVTGQITTQGQIREVTGTAWLDREWSSQPLASDQTGWDWFSLHFETGQKLMGFRLRGTEDVFTSATWIEADGSATALEPGAFQADPTAYDWEENQTIPTSWRIYLTEKNLDISVQALNPKSWMDTNFSYWEGPVRVTGTHLGRGYLEMTGYPDP